MLVSKRIIGYREKVETGNVYIQVSVKDRHQIISRKEDINKRTSHFFSSTNRDKRQQLLSTEKTNIEEGGGGAEFIL